MASTNFNMVFSDSQLTHKRPEAKISDFIEIRLEEVPSPVRMYEMFRGTKSEGLANVQFLCVLNIFMGGSKEQSRDAMPEFL